MRSHRDRRLEICSRGDSAGKNQAENELLPWSASEGEVGKV